MLFRFASVVALISGISMAAAPLGAAELQRGSLQRAGAFDPDSMNARNHRHWRHDHVDAGDVIGGLLVIGTIAAVASAASRASRDNEYRYPPRDYPYDYRGGPYASRYGDGGGLGRAVEMCAREVERNARIRSIDSVNRTGAGWDVSGTLRTGATFRCTIGADGRIDSVDFGQGSGYVGAAEDKQWDDERYAAARAAQDAAGAPIAPYAGGPIEGEAGHEPGDDDRYGAVEAPDFPG